MYSKILIATDGSELASRAVEHGIGLAAAVGADVVFVTVTGMWSAMEIASDIEQGNTEAVTMFEEAAAASAARILDTAQAKADAAGVNSQIRHVPDREPAEGILDTAELEDCDLIVMATHGRRGIRKMLIGSQTSEVIVAGKRPVLAVR